MKIFQDQITLLFEELSCYIEVFKLSDTTFTVPFVKTLCCNTRFTLSMPRPLSFLKQLDFLPCLFEYLSSLTHSTPGKVLNFPEPSHVLLPILTVCVLFEDKTASHVLVKIKLIFYFLSRKIVLNVKYI